MPSYGVPDKMVRVIAGIYRDSECAVLGLGHEEGKSRQEKRVRWNFTTVLGDLDFADDFELLPSKFNDLHEKTGLGPTGGKIS